jgi:hypothetical protein
MRARLFVLGLMAAMLGVPAPASASGRWMAVERAPITPGAEIILRGNQCTANFVFRDRRSVYLGLAAHCAATGDATDTDGCTATLMPLGTRATVEGARDPATLVYNSWTTMQRRGETREALCLTNDFALVRLSPYDALRVNPTVPHWGGPTGLTRSAEFGDWVVSYGNSRLWLGTEPLQPHRGAVLDSSYGGRAFKVTTAPPGIPGDSGSGYLDAQGRALGVLSTLEIAPTPGANNLTGLGKALDYLRNHTQLRVTLVKGTEPFRG